jgi:hypothetical protein
MMRNLEIEELELVAGGAPVGGETPAFENSQSKCNNGVGNGDQEAPGFSFTNNQAENTEGPTGTHTSGFAIIPNECNDNAPPD